MLLITFTVPSAEFDRDEWDANVLIEEQGGVTKDDPDVTLISQAVLWIEGGPGLPTHIYYAHGGRADVKDIQGKWSIS